MFITLYGINNIGKSTQAKLLVESLNKSDKKAVHIKYPVYEIEPTGSLINQVLRSGKKQEISEEELQMWYTLNRYQFQPQLQKYLDEGFIVIAEDYTGTSVSWGTAKGASKKWLETINSHLIPSDLSILITGKRTLSSIESGHLHETNDELSQKVIAVLEQLAEQNDWTVIQKQEKIEDTQSLLQEIIFPKL